MPSNSAAIVWFSFHLQYPPMLSAGQLCQRIDMKTTPVPGRLVTRLSEGSPTRWSVGRSRVPQVDGGCTEAGALEVRLQSASGLVQGREAIHRFSMFFPSSTLQFYRFMAISWPILGTLMYFISRGDMSTIPTPHVRWFSFPLGDDLQGSGTNWLILV